MNKAEKVVDTAKQIVRFVRNSHLTDETLIESVASIITAEYGDGEDKERVNWLDNGGCIKRNEFGDWLVWESTVDYAPSKIGNLRSALDATRKETK